MKLLISGSRTHNPAMLQRARIAVERAKAQGDVEIIVGDAWGVDTAVVRACLDLGVPFRCYGKQAVSLVSFCPLDRYEKQGNTFYERDEYMASICDMGLFIWNGKPGKNGKPGGTVYTYQCTKKLDKPAWLLNFSE